MTIKINSGLLEYPILNEYDQQVATLIIDKNDMSIVDKMINLKKRANEVSEMLQSVHTEQKDAITENEMSDILKLYNDAAAKMVEETEKVFGDGIVHDIYAASYAMNPNFVPSPDALYEIYENFIPVVIEALKKSAEPKYSPAKKGASNPKTRKEIIEALKNE